MTDADSYPRWLPHGLGWRWVHVRKAYRRRGDWVPRIGGPSYLRVALTPVLGRAVGRKPVRVCPPGYKHPVYCRPASTDLAVLKQVLVDEEYSCVADEPAVRSIIDCGANVGYATFYLLSKYPAARAVVVEPDPGNMAVCRRTLAPFADRVTYVEAGVWSSTVDMMVDRGHYRDGREWSFQVRPVKAGETPDFRAVTVSDLMAAGGFDTVDLLKVDIEGSETELFASADWLAKVRTLVIELHDAECERVVGAATERLGFVKHPAREVTVFRQSPAVATAGLGTA